MELLNMYNVSTDTTARFKAPAKVYDGVSGLGMGQLVEVPLGLIKQYKGLVANLKHHATQEKPVFKLGCLRDSTREEIRCTCSFDEKTVIFTIKTT